MGEAHYQGPGWGAGEENSGLLCLNNFDPSFYGNDPKTPKYLADTNQVLWCGMVKALLDADRLVWMCDVRHAVKSGSMTEEAASAVDFQAIPNPVGSAAFRDKVREFCKGDPDVAQIPALIDLVRFEVLQAIRSSRPIAEPKPVVGGSSAMGDLGALPVIALVLLGVAAIAGVTYLGAEGTKSVASAWSAIEIEKTWAVYRAQAEIAIAAQNIAAGHPYVMSDWAKLRSNVAQASQTSWAPLVALGGVAVLVGAAAVVMREKAGAAPKANPAHRLVPRRHRRRLRRKHNQAIAQLNPARKHRKARKAAPKRSRKHNPKTAARVAKPRKTNPKRKRTQKGRAPAAFVRSQRAKGRTHRQAQAAWKLGHRRKGHVKK